MLPAGEAEIASEMSYRPGQRAVPAPYALPAAVAGAGLGLAVARGFAEAQACRSSSFAALIAPA
jgi:hypothetical protein